MDIRSISEEEDDVEVTQEELMFHSDVRENIVSVSGLGIPFYLRRRKWVNSVDTFRCRKISSANELSPSSRALLDLWHIYSLSATKLPQ